MNKLMPSLPGKKKKKPAPKATKKPVGTGKKKKKVPTYTPGLSGMEG